MDLITGLKEAGLKTEEANLYLALLELGNAPASVLARKTGIPRVNTYYILGQLKNKGLVSEVEKNGTKFFSGSSPDILLKREESIMEKLTSLVPELKSIQNTLATKPKIRYFEGRSGIEQIYEDTLTGKEEIVGYSNLELVTETIDKYMQDYAKKKSELKIRSRIIAPGSIKSKVFLEIYYPHDPLREITEILFVSPKSFDFENDIFIYGNKLAIISLRKDEMFGMILESNSVTKTQKSLFNLAWLGATSFVAS